MNRKNKRFLAAAKVVHTNQAKDNCQKSIKEYQKYIPKPMKKQIENTIQFLEDSEEVRKCMRLLFFIALAHHELGLKFSFGMTEDDRNSFDPEVLDMYCESNPNFEKVKQYSQCISIA